MFTTIYEETQTYQSEMRRQAAQARLVNKSGSLTQRQKGRGRVRAVKESQGADSSVQMAGSQLY